MNIKEVLSGYNYYMLPLGRRLFLHYRGKLHPYSGLPQAVTHSSLYVINGDLMLHDTKHILFTFSSLFSNKCCGTV